MQIKKLKFILGRIENNVGKGENAGNQHFLLSPRCFQKASSAVSLSPDCGIKRVLPRFTWHGSYAFTLMSIHLHFSSQISEPCFEEKDVKCISMIHCEQTRHSIHKNNFVQQSTEPSSRLVHVL